MKVSFIVFSPFSLANDCRSLCIVNDPGLELESINDFLRRLCNIFLALIILVAPKTATALSVLKFSGRILKDINASCSCAVSLWKEESNKNCNRCVVGWSGLSSISTTLASEEVMRSFRKWCDWELSSDIKEHNIFIANGTCPHSCVICVQLLALISGSNLETKVWAKASSSGFILKPLWPWKCTSINSRDSRVVTMNLTVWVCLKISSRSCRTTSFTFGQPLSSKSSALSRINTEGFKSLLNSWQSSSSMDRCWTDGCLFIVGCLRKLRNFEVRSALECSPRKDTQYTGSPWDWSSWPAAIATDVFPNPGEPQTYTSRIDSESTCLMISSHSLWRPAKSGTIGGRAARKSNGPKPIM